MTEKTHRNINDSGSLFITYHSPILNIIIFIYDLMCNTNWSDRLRTRILYHHLYTRLCGYWVRCTFWMYEIKIIIFFHSTILINCICTIIIEDISFTSFSWHHLLYKMHKSITSRSFSDNFLSNCFITNTILHFRAFYSFFHLMKWRWKMLK